MSEDEAKLSTISDRRLVRRKRGHRIRMSKRARGVVGDGSNGLVKRHSGRDVQLAAARERRKRGVAFVVKALAHGKSALACKKLVLGGRVGRILAEDWRKAEG